MERCAPLAVLAVSLAAALACGPPVEPGDYGDPGSQEEEPPSTGDDPAEADDPPIQKITPARDGLLEGHGDHVELELPVDGLRNTSADTWAPFGLVATARGVLLFGESDEGPRAAWFDLRSDVRWRRLPAVRTVAVAPDGQELWALGHDATLGRVKLARPHVALVPIEPLDGGALMSSRLWAGAGGSLAVGRHDGQVVVRDDDGTRLEATGTTLPVRGLGGASLEDLWAVASQPQGDEPALSAVRRRGPDGWARVEGLPSMSWRDIAVDEDGAWLVGDCSLVRRELREPATLVVEVPVCGWRTVPVRVVARNADEAWIVSGGCVQVGVGTAPGMCSWTTLLWDGKAWAEMAHSSSFSLALDPRDDSVWLAGDGTVHHWTRR